MSTSSEHPVPPPGAGFKAGADRICITPPLGSIINGELVPGEARHIHDDLFVRALVLDDGASRLAFAIVDTCVLDRPVCDEAKQLIREQTGIPMDHVLIAADHTHSGGSVCGAHLTPADEAYRSSIPGRIAEAVRGAVEGLAPARIGWGSGSVPQHVFCRRLFIREGAVYANQLGQTGDRVKMNWDSPHPADGEPCAPVDPEVFVLSVHHADGRPLAVLANYSLHYVGDVRLGDISADYFGVFASRIGELLGADASFVGILSNGTSGDINNFDPKTGPGSPAPYTQIGKVAEDVAQEVARVVKGIRHRTEAPLRARMAECGAGTRRPSGAEVDEALAVLAGRPVERLSSWPDNYAREQILLAGYPAEVFLPLQVFHVGELAIAAWPGEIFASTGLELKAKQREPLFNIELANGWYGYIPPPEQFPLGSYETWRMRTSFLETNAIPKMMASFEELLK